MTDSEYDQMTMSQLRKEQKAAKEREKKIKKELKARKEKSGPSDRQKEMSAKMSAKMKELKEKHPDKKHTEIFGMAAAAIKNPADKKGE